MSSLILPRIWTSQPPGPTPIDWSNPVTRGIISVQDGRGYDHITGMGTLANSGAVTTSVSRFGVDRSFGTNSLTFPLAPYSGTYNDSLLFIGSSETIDWGNGNINNGLGFRAAGANHGFANDYQTTTGPGVLWSGIGLAIGVSYGQFVVSDLWVNGNKLTGLTRNAPAAIPQNASVMTSEASQRGVLSVRWTRRLSANEIISLSANPWQIFKAPPRKLWMADVDKKIPVLSAATAINITSTTATPQCVLTF
jgi:hypothetical protein